MCSESEATPVTELILPGIRRCDECGRWAIYRVRFGKRFHVWLYRCRLHYLLLLAPAGKGV